jgi:hypothetical protein
MPIALALMVSSAAVASAQAVRAPQLRPTPEMFTSEVARSGLDRSSTSKTPWRARRMSPTTQGMLIGGGIGGGATALFSVLYIQSTESRDYSSMGLPVLIGTALGAIIGAAIGAGFER